MGCYLASACQSEKEKQRALVIELSPENYNGEKMANDFIRYVKYREMALNAKIVPKENMNNTICIRYSTYGETKTIFNGTDFSHQYFAPLYQKIIMMND